ncbi:Protein of unknown function [Leuconostoc citreum]|nr:Protein of unknown function [Leuconostoc citreum]CDX66278.1 Protein of unknown function [Leuconostoc citreum]
MIEIYIKADELEKS